MGLGEIGTIGRVGLTQSKGVGVPYLGQVATRGYMPAKRSSLRYCMSRSGHFARDAIASLRIVVPNWYTNYASSFAETGIGGAALVEASIEYPAGSFTRVTFSGASTGSIPSGENLVSDVVPVSIPNGGEFFVRIYTDCSSGFAYSGGVTGQTYRAGDGCEYGSSGISNRVMGGAVSLQAPSSMRFPAAIVAMTRRPSVISIGDSIDEGSAAAPSAAGDGGILWKSLGPSLAYINGGISANRLQYYAASHQRQAELAAYCTHVIIQSTRNDVSSRTTAQVQADHETVRALFAPKPIYLVTTPPRTTSTDSWATAGNQTVWSAVPEATKATLNTWKRSLPTGYAGCFDIAALLEDAENQAVWASDGTALKYTGDGTHPSAYGDEVVRASAVINPLIFR